MPYIETGLRDFCTVSLSLANSNFRLENRHFGSLKKLTRYRGHLILGNEKAPLHPLSRQAGFAFLSLAPKRGDPAPKGCDMRDTSPEAIAIQARIHRSLSGAERLRLAFEMSLAARALSLARLQGAHPEWSEAELRRELLRYAYSKNPLPPALK